MATTLQYTDELITVVCWCGIHHAVPRQLREYQLRSHDDGKEVTVYCPLGHEYWPSGTPKWKRESELRASLEAQLRAERDQHEAERKAHAATKGQLTKTRKRVQGGVCPCCNRSFVQLARHMKTKHPDFTP